MALGDSDYLVIFGISGDLAYKMTLPSLYRLEKRGLLTVPVLGVAANEWGPDGLANRARAAISEHAGEPLDEKVFARLMAKMTYISGDFGNEDLYHEVAAALAGVSAPCFYLEIPPSLFDRVAQGLGAVGLFKGNARLVVEKPFGYDRASAAALADELHLVVSEEQLFRIDHFLGKEPVQDILYLRFANSLLEPLWSRRHVRSIMITMAEQFGVEDRGHFYDPVGALRDVVQNHLLQILALTGLEPPTGGSVTSRRLDFFRGVEAADPKHVVRGQYDGYLQVPGVAKHSDTETFVALRLAIDSWRWSGVPVLIRTGKKMPMTATEIVVRLQPPPKVSLSGHTIRYAGHDDIVLRIGTNAGVGVSLRVKQPGVDKAAPQLLNVDFGATLGYMPTPYERLLTDAMRGDHTLFPDQSTEDETWRIVEPILNDPPKAQSYRPGTWGPQAAIDMARSVGGWREPEAQTDG